MDMFSKVHGANELMRKLKSHPWDELSIVPYAEASPTQHHTYLGMALGLTLYGIEYRITYVGWFGKRRWKTFKEQVCIGSFYSDSVRIDEQILATMRKRFDDVRAQYRRNVRMLDSCRNVISSTTS